MPSCLSLGINAFHIIFIILHGFHRGFLYLLHILFELTASLNSVSICRCNGGVESDCSRMVYQVFSQLQDEDCGDGGIASCSNVYR